MKCKIILLGFMGSGKTTIGKALGNLLHKEWIDLDTQIEIEIQTSIPDLFAQYGEDHFRQIENKVLTETLSKSESLVVSTGGGIVEKSENRALLKKLTTVYLKWNFDTLYERIAEDKNRPLVKSYEQLEDLYIKREALYEEVSSCIIVCEGKSIEALAKEIVEKVGEVV